MEEDIKRISISKIISIESILRGDTIIDHFLFNDSKLCFAIIIAKHKNNKKDNKYFLFDYWKRFNNPNTVVHESNRRPSCFLLKDITEINFSLDPRSYFSVNFSPYDSIVGDYEIYVVFSNELKKMFDISFRSQIRRLDYHYFIIKEFIKTNYNIIFNE